MKIKIEKNTGEEQTSHFLRMEMIDREKYRSREEKPSNGRRDDATPYFRAYLSFPKCLWTTSKRESMRDVSRMIRSVGSSSTSSRDSLKLPYRSRVNVPIEERYVFVSKPDDSFLQGTTLNLEQRIDQCQERLSSSTGPERVRRKFLSSLVYRKM